MPCTYLTEVLALLLASDPNRKEYKIKVVATPLAVHNEQAHEFQLTREEYECALEERGQYVLVRVFGTPVDANDSGSNLKFLIIRDPVGQAAAGHIEIVGDLSAYAEGPVTVRTQRSAV